MSAWYVFSTLGFYPFCPSKAEFVLSSPAIKSAVIHTGKGTDFIINTISNSENNVYCSSHSLNGQLKEGTYLKYNSIMEGGRPEFEMTDTPGTHRKGE